MRTVLVIFLAVILVAAAFFAGAAYARRADAPIAANLRRALALKTHEAYSLDGSQTTLAAAWWFQMSDAIAPPEPATDASGGVRLARIRAVDASSSSIVVDWESRAGDAVTNRVPHEQRLSVPNVAYVYVLHPLKDLEGRWMPPLFEQLDHPAFFSRFRTSDATGNALRASDWWITMYRNHEAVEIIQSGGGRP